MQARTGNVGVLTFHRCINYGSYWQARCLVEGLAAMGADAVLLDYRSPRSDRAEWRCALSPLLPIRTSFQDYDLYKKKMHKFFAAIKKLPLSSPFPLDDPAQAGRFRLVIVGSDEVWNLKHPWYGGCAVFYGEGLSTDHLVSYAATFGNFASHVRLQGLWGDRLRRFSRICVRDLNSARLIREALALEPELALDPCLQFPQPILATRNDGNGRYAAVYGHGFPSWFQKAVRQWADRRAYRLISIGYRNDWADRQWIDAGPNEFAAFIASAKAVVTNFFHGCVFSLVYEKPFACVLSDYRSNKLRDLAEIVGAQRHIIVEACVSPQLETVLDCPLEPAIARRISILRANSSIYLDHVVC
ncbi:MULTISPECIES: polysaccharide pyruvyl transferase family protein [unclassified Rhizobium]|uniref:polysaccharide pyruvyl transferase family protein n=1 Tax=unclassified Rhizobium TaxID=2613769 RepID=UPI000B53613F|nr:MULTISPECIES: polysaccharide pyruvyl transferase family protein [unclassified Rhizobium]